MHLVIERSLGQSLASIACLGLLVGCAANVKMPPGLAMPKGQTVRLYCQGVEVMSVDGVSPPTNMRPSVASGKTLELAPGKHLLRVKWVQGIQSLNGGGSGHTGRTDIHAEIVD